MAPKPRDRDNDPQTLDARNAARRKLVQAENKRELERDVEALKSKVEDAEGLDMREVIQDKINAWFVENRHPETGEYPDFPDADEGGCDSQCQNYSLHFLPADIIEPSRFSSETVRPEVR